MIPVFRNHQSSISRSAAVSAGILLLAATTAYSQAKGPAIPSSMVIFRGDSLQTSGLRLSNWGSGAVEEDKSKIFSGTESLRLTTHGLYQGASLIFAKPVDLSPMLASKFSYLKIAVLPPQDKITGAGGEAGFPRGPGGIPGGQSGFPGFGSSGPGRGGGQFNPGGSGGSGGAFGRIGQVETQQNRKIENLRVVMVTSGGRALEFLLPLANASRENEWKILAIPLSAVPNLTTDDAQIKEIRLFGDAPGSVHIGSIGVVEDPSPITLDTVHDKTVQRLAKYQYLANANAGVTPLVYSWDWDGSDGIQDETEGRNVIHVFRKASVDDAGKNTDFIVTVSVSDLYHIKAPVRTTFKVHVTP